MLATLSSTHSSHPGTPDADSDDRRSYPRHWLECGVDIQFVPKPSFRLEKAIVPNVSPGGMGLITLRPLAPGTILGLLLGPDIGEAKVVFAEVKHVEPLEDGCWLVGCGLQESIEY